MNNTTNAQPILSPQKAKEVYAKEKLISFAKMIDEVYEITYEDDNGKILTTVELVDDFLSKI